MGRSRISCPALRLASAFIGATTLLAKALGTAALGPPLSALQVSHGRFIFALVFTLGVFFWRRPSLVRPALKLHFGRTVLGWAGVTLMFAAAAFIPLSNPTAISFLNPVFAMMLAIPLLGEKVGPVRWIAAVIAMLGALILLRPTATSFQPAAFLALSAAIFLGAELIFIKRLTGGEPPLQILLINNLLGVLISTLAVAFVWRAPSLLQWMALVSIGGLMAAAQLCFVNAMVRGDASFVSPFLYATLIFALLYDSIIFGVVPSSVSVLGAVVILAGAVLLAWCEAVRKAPMT
jgi:drug/metabolite transporter (DMT)-like permease